MIPVRLELKNFLPYRSPDPVRFDGVHLACLTGTNGAGKSSLLDAIAWALWGKARSNSSEELIHLGQSDMYVQLDFEQEGLSYRVLRRRSRAKRSQGALDLFVFDEDEEKYTVISEPGVRATQEKINEILRMDYDTFVHSAFLQQGKADAFTTTTPARRKQILSDILGLDQWAKYENAVKDRLKTITNNLTYFDQRIDEINAELARKPGLEQDLETATQSHKDAESAREAAETRLKEVEHAPGDLRNAQDNKAERERRVRELQRELDEVQANIESKQEQIAGYQETIAAQADIEEGYNALKSAREINQELSDKLRQLTSLKDERHKLTSQIEAARARLESEIEAVERTITELEQSTTTDYEAELETVQEEVAQLQAKEIERDKLDDHVSGLREELATVNANFQTVTEEGKALRERLDQLETTDEEAVTCPLCGQPLTAEHREQLVAEINVEVETKREDYRKHQDRIATLNTQMKDQREQITTLNGELKGLQPLVEKMGRLQTQAQTAQDAATRLNEERDRLTELQKELSEESFAADVREQLAQLDTQQTEVGYNESSHEDAQEQLKTHLRFEELHTQLQVALNSINSFQESLDGEKLRAERVQKAIDDTQAEIADLDTDITRLNTLVEEYNARDQEVRQQRTLERNAYERLVSARQALDALESQAARKEDLENRRDEHREQEALYSDLRRAFGKNGVPAMIIETAIPELEAKANELLTRMTDGRMNLRLNTQREKVSGGVSETLDIEIADELGTRGYELYSGGEAFRINFALRVAISQMLARRAGAHLRTLFIDEGFGTQDGTGRSKLVEAINAIQDEFDMILVVTHIDELRDSFPIHIMVDKTPTGSRIGIQ